MSDRHEDWAHRSTKIVQLVSEDTVAVAVRVCDSHVAVERSRHLLAETAPLIISNSDHVETASAPQPIVELRPGSQKQG